jgi:hypothetical protein
MISSRMSGVGTALKTALMNAMNLLRPQTCCRSCLEIFGKNHSAYLIFAIDS